MRRGFFAFDATPTVFYLLHCAIFFMALSAWSLLSYTPRMFMLFLGFSLNRSHRLPS